MLRRPRSASPESNLGEARAQGEDTGPALPQDLLEHMRAQDWHCPVLTQQQLIEVSEELFKELKKSKKLRRRS
ncbi:hypothetical protein [Myxococcus sp. CA040A]|uniref:hypothetical protein n=1 Tax=Myxococcus sp. CA040A TaxID=2741738 RepID=UPI00157BA5B7|nr:hypothetical protein [Myxococcus sp. CA040A]NTX05890.1 hypothetical protein [Myxococcus sp. CA040A]